MTAIGRVGKAVPRIREQARAYTPQRFATECGPYQIGLGPSCHEQFTPHRILFACDIGGEDVVVGWLR